MSKVLVEASSRKLSTSMEGETTANLQESEVDGKAQTRQQATRLSEDAAWLNSAAIDL